MVVLKTFKLLFNLVQIDGPVNVHPINLIVLKLHEFAICTSSQGANERWQVMSKLVQFTGVHFPDLNPNSYDNLNIMNLDLNVSNKVKFSANDQNL